MDWRMSDPGNPDFNSDDPGHFGDEILRIHTEPSREIGGVFLNPGIDESFPDFIRTFYEELTRFLFS